MHSVGYLFVLSLQRSLPRTLELPWILGVLVVLLVVPKDAAAACSIERSPLGGAGTPLIVRVSKDCTAAERDAQAVRAADVLAALGGQRGVDIEGAVIVGDLVLDSVLSAKPDVVSLPPRVQQRMSELQVTHVHVLSGPIMIRDSLVRGTVNLSAKGAMVMVRGTVAMAGTTFERMADFSRIIFLGTVDFSGAVFRQQGFFIETIFEQPATFQQTAFGVHSRFHKALFGEAVTFHRAGFNGLSEFLEVSFNKDARFSQTYFKFGSGFSGSRFSGTADFSEATFDREAYFSFARFDGDAYFRRATFKAETNFADAEFRGLDDFSKTLFNHEPRFTRVKANAQAIPKGLQDARVLYVIAASLLGFSLLFAFILRKG